MKRIFEIAQPFSKVLETMKQKAFLFCDFITRGRLD
jgi:hypothetical protein